MSRTCCSSLRQEIESKAQPWWILSSHCKARCLRSCSLGTSCWERGRCGLPSRIEWRWEDQHWSQSVGLWGGHTRPVCPCRVQLHLEQSSCLLKVWHWRLSLDGRTHHLSDLEVQESLLTCLPLHRFHSLATQVKLPSCCLQNQSVSHTHTWSWLWQES